MQIDACEIKRLLPNAIRRPGTRVLGSRRMDGPAAEAGGE